MIDDTAVASQEPENLTPETEQAPASAEQSALEETAELGGVDLTYYWKNGDGSFSPADPQPDFPFAPDEPLLGDTAPPPSTPDPVSVARAAETRQLVDSIREDLYAYGQEVHDKVAMKLLRIAEMV